VRYAVPAVLVGVAALLLAGSANVAYGLAAAYGADTPGTWSVIAVLVVVPGGLALLCLIGARDPVGPPRPRTSVLAAGVLAVFAATVSGADAYGGRVHERDRAAMATACSPEDTALLTAVDAPGAHTEPSGEPDGGCSMVISWVPDAARAEAEVVSSLERGGWQRTERDGAEQVLRRGEAVLRLSASSDGKATDVLLTLQP
jgi:hypothetical protein